MSTRRQKYLYGLRAGIPVIFGFIPVGIAYAIMARQAGFTAVDTVLMSVLVFAGASQMMAVGMYAQGASVIAIILATFIINFRHLVMSIVVHNKMKEANTGQRLLASFGITDESFAIFSIGSEAASSVWYFFGLITVTYTSWIAGSAIGALAADFLPTIISASFGVALYAMFVGIVVPGVKGNWKLAVLVIATAVCNSVLGQFLASSWSLIISTLVAAAVGAALNINVGGQKEEKEGTCT